MNITEVYEDYSEIIGEDSSYKLWAVLVMNSLLVLERLFKNSKLFCKCTRDGCTLTNRTPPLSPDASQAIERPRKNSGADSNAVNMDEVMKALEKIKESQDAISASISSRGALSDESLGEYIEWKNRKTMKKEIERRNNRAALSNEAMHERSLSKSSES